MYRDPQTHYPYSLSNNELSPSKVPKISGLDPKIQKISDDLMQQVPASHVSSVVLNGKTGEVLSIGSKSKLDLPNLALQNFPAASLTKIITAICLLESGVSLDTEATYPVRYQVPPHFQTKSPQNVKTERSTNLCNAFAYSNSLAIAKFLWEAPGSSAKKLNQFMQVARKCGYNQRIDPNINLESPIIYDTPLRNGSESKQALKLARLACGFHSSYTNCLHQAQLFAGITSSNGIMPKLKILMEGTPYQSDLGADLPISTPEVLDNLRKMLATVVQCGTAHKRASNILIDEKLRIIAKTGTLIGQPIQSPYHPNTISTFQGLKQWTVAACDSLVVAAVICQPDLGQRGVVQDLCFKTLKAII